MLINYLYETLKTEEIMVAGNYNYSQFHPQENITSYLDAKSLINLNIIIPRDKISSLLYFMNKANTSFEGLVIFWVICRFKLPKNL